MRINYEDMISRKIYVVITNNGDILKCFGNKYNAYVFATRECYKWIKEDDENKYIFEMISNTDKDEEEKADSKLKIIEEHCFKLIKNEDDYYKLCRVEKYDLDIDGIYGSC